MNIRIFAGMNTMKRWLVWLSRIHRCRGFGIQSPTDYAFVRYVVNEHYPYYAYQLLGDGDDWQRRKLGRLYLRLANWRQPSVMMRDEYEAYWAAGCRKTLMLDSEPEIVELARIEVGEGCCERLEAIYRKTDAHSLLVVEDICRDWELWREVERDARTGVTFDLYYCGIVFFDKKRQKKNYRVNF